MRENTSTPYIETIGMRVGVRGIAELEVTTGRVGDDKVNNQHRIDARDIGQVARIHVRTTSSPIVALRLISILVGIPGRQVTAPRAEHDVILHSQCNACTL
jgi:hypothetical protein